MTPQILHLSISNTKYISYIFSFTDFQQYYYFLWTDIETYSVINSLGIINTQNIKRQINKNILVLSESTDSIINSESEEKLVVRCESSDDCYKYVMELNYFAGEVRAEFATPSLIEHLQDNLRIE